MRCLCVCLLSSLPLALVAEVLTLTSDGDAAVAANWDANRTPDLGDTLLVGNGRRLSVSSDLTADALWTDAGNDGRGSVAQSAGVVRLVGTGAEDASASLRMGNDGGTVGSYRLTGGSLSVPSGRLSVGCWGAGLLSLSGATVRSMFGGNYPTLGEWNNGSTVGEGALVACDGAQVAFSGTEDFVCIGERGRGSLAVRETAKVASEKEIRLGVYSDGSGAEGRLVLGANGLLEAPAIRSGKGRGCVTIVGGTLAPRPRKSVTRDFLGTAGGSGSMVAASVAGATVDVKGGDCVTFRASLDETRLTRANLAHRWRFNGTLADEVGGQTATLAGSIESGGNCAGRPSGVASGRFARQCLREVGHGGDSGICRRRDDRALGDAARVHQEMGSHLFREFGLGGRLVTEPAVPVLVHDEFPARLRNDALEFVE